MKLFHILKSKKGVAAELVAISLMFVFTVLSFSALLTSNSVLRGVQNYYSEEQAKIYAITLSQAISDQLTIYNSCYADPDGNPMPDVYTQYNNDLNNPIGSTVSSNLSSYLYDKYVINFEKNYEDSDKKVFDDFHFDSKSSPAIKDDCQFDISIRFESPSTSWDDFKIKIETKATYKDSSYVVEKEYTLYTIDGSYLSDNLEVPCYWDEL